MGTPDSGLLKSSLIGEFALSSHKWKSENRRTSWAGEECI